MRARKSSDLRNVYRSTGASVRVGQRASAAAQREREKGERGAGTLDGSPLARAVYITVVGE